MKIVCSPNCIISLQHNTSKIESTQTKPYTQSFSIFPQDAHSGGNSTSLTKRGGGEWTELDGFQVTLPWSRYNNEKMESRNKKSCNIRCLYTEYAQRNAWRWDTTNTQFINSLLINLGCFLVKIILHVCHPVCSFCLLKVLRCRWSDKWQLSAQDLLKRCW